MWYWLIALPHCAMPHAGSFAATSIEGASPRPVGERVKERDAALEVGADVGAARDREVNRAELLGHRVLVVLRLLRPDRHGREGDDERPRESPDSDHHVSLLDTSQALEHVCIRSVPRGSRDDRLEAGIAAQAPALHQRPGAEVHGADVVGLPGQLP